MLPENQLFRTNPLPPKNFLANFRLFLRTSLMNDHLPNSFSLLHMVFFNFSFPLISMFPHSFLFSLFCMFSKRDRHNFKKTRENKCENKSKNTSHTGQFHLGKRSTYKRSTNMTKKSCRAC